MSFLILIQTIVATDCFKLSTKCKYNAQRSSVEFIATPSKTLTGEEKRLCEQVINGQQFHIQIQLGNIIFAKQGLTYSKDNEINIEVECQGNINNCAVSHVNSVQAATYTLFFSEIDLTLSSIINFYEIDRYKHLSCIRTSNLIYDIVKQSMEVQVMDPVVQCPCDLINVSANHTDNVFITSKVAGSDISTSPYNTTNNYSGIFKFNNSGNNNSTTPSQLKSFWQEIVSIGPYTAKELPLISMLLIYIRTTPVLLLSMRVQLLTEIKQVRNASSQPTKSFYYNQSIEYSMGKLTNQNQVDCFTAVDIELHKTFFYVNTMQNHNPKSCTREYVENIANKSYDSIVVQIIASQNIDKSGFNYYVEHILDDFNLGDDINRRFACKDDQDCAQLQQIARIHRNYYNMSVSMKMLFMNNNSIIFAISQSAEFSLTQYNQTNISVLTDWVCIQIQPVNTGAQQIQFTIFTYKFDLSQYMNAENTQYCSSLQAAEVAYVDSIISKMKGNVDIQPHISLIVGSKIVGDIEVIVYETPDANSLVWIMCIILGALGIVGSIGVSVGFRKQLHVWDTGHSIIIKSD